MKKNIEVKILNNGVTVMDKDGKPVPIGGKAKVPEDVYRQHKASMMRVNIKVKKDKKEK